MHIVPILAPDGLKRHVEGEAEPQSLHVCKDVGEEPMEEGDGAGHDMANGYAIVVLPFLGQGLHDLVVADGIGHDGLEFCLCEIDNLRGRRRRWGRRDVVGKVEDGNGGGRHVVGGGFGCGRGKNGFLGISSFLLPPSYTCYSPIF